jgi:hypothetical protein
MEREEKKLSPGGHVVVFFRSFRAETVTFSFIMNKNIRKSDNGQREKVKIITNNKTHFKICWNYIMLTLYNLILFVPFFV